jgi:hypothetical protein
LAVDIFLNLGKPLIILLGRASQVPLCYPLPCCGDSQVQRSTLIWIEEEGNKNIRAKTRSLTNKRERIAIFPSNGTEVRGTVVLHKVDVLLNGEVVKHTSEQVVVVHVEDGAWEVAGELEQLRRVVYGQPVGHDHVGRGRVPSHGVVAVLVVFLQARQGDARRQRLVEQLDCQEACAVRVPILYYR